MTDYTHAYAIMQANVELLMSKTSCAPIPVDPCTGFYSPDETFYPDPERDRDAADSKAPILDINPVTEQDRLRMELNVATNNYVLGLRYLPAWVTMPSSQFGVDSTIYMPGELRYKPESELRAYENVVIAFIKAKKMLQAYSRIPLTPYFFADGKPVKW